jgi:hypothetical protein
LWRRSRPKLGCGAKERRRRNYWVSKCGHINSFKIQSSYHHHHLPKTNLTKILLSNIHTNVFLYGSECYTPTTEQMYTVETAEKCFLERSPQVAYTTMAHKDITEEMGISDTNTTTKTLPKYKW